MLRTDKQTCQALGQYMASLHFQARIEIYGINPYVFVSAKQANVLKSNWQKPMPVCVQINGMPDDPWHINMMPKGNGDFYLYLHGDVRKASRTKIGDTVEVSVSFDESYHSGPMHPMPESFREALEQNPKANTNWDALIPSRQKEILRYIAGLKTEEARKRNLEKVIHILSGNEGRFMARDWKDGK
jgi:hypothetical protein